MHNTRMEGDALWREYNNRTELPASAYFNFLGVAALSHTAQAAYVPDPRLQLNGGFSWSRREVRSREQQMPPRSSFSGTLFTQRNILQSGLFGASFRPISPLALSVDAELGRADTPFFPISERRFHNISVRAAYRKRTLRVSTSYRTAFNLNPTMLSAYSARTKVWTADASGTPHRRFTWDASYSYTHWRSLAGIAFFSNFNLQQGGQSLYLSQLHGLHVGARTVLTRRLEFYAAYSGVHDSADGRSFSIGAPVPGLPGSWPAFSDAQTFPLSYRSPMARLSFQIMPAARLNLGYQHYGYHQRLDNLQDYRAHTAYLSLLWTF
jgi:hypothetical protein